MASTKLYLYARGEAPVWWIGGYPAGAKQRTTRIKGRGPDGEAPGVVQRLLAAEQSQVDALLAQTDGTGIVTVESYAREFLAGYKTHGKDNYEQTQALNDYVLPTLGRMELSAVKATDILDVLLSMRKQGLSKRTAKGCAPRTVLKVWKVVKVFFKRAVIDDKITANPALKVDAAKLPSANEDHSPTWRDGAVFDAEEAAVLIHDERLPIERRVFYALLFYTGARFGEISALTVGSYKRGPATTGKLTIDKSFQSRSGKVKGTKTGTKRYVPVHAELAQILREWIPETAQPDDLIVPDVYGHNQRQQIVYKQWRRDLKIVGLRHRRIHDTRRSFITWALAAGAQRDTLRWVTHGRDWKDIIDLYSQPEWGTACKEVAKFSIPAPAKVLPIVSLPSRLPAKAADLHSTYNVGISEAVQVVAMGGDSSRCSPPSPGPSLTLKDTEAQSNPSEALAETPVWTVSESDVRLSQLVSAVSDAITALNAGDLERVRVLLMGALR